MRVHARPNSYSLDMEMYDIVTGNFAPPRWIISAPKSLRIGNWNIDRGQQLQGVTDFRTLAERIQARL